MGIKIHGHHISGKRTSEYNTWDRMKSRCNNPKDDSYQYYGGRGIKVCEKWSQSFKAFLDDVGLKPSRSHSLDRYPDKGGNYEPGNTRWATEMEQQSNRADNVLITHNSKTKTISEWSRELGIPKTTISGRVKKGWPPNKVLSTHHSKGDGQQKKILGNN